MNPCSFPQFLNLNEQTADDNSRPTLYHDQYVGTIVIAVYDTHLPPASKVLHCKAFRNECVCGGCNKLPLDLRYHRNKDIITDFLAEVREQVDQEITPQVLLKAGFVSDRIRHRSAVNGCDDLEASIRHMVFNKYFEDFAGDVLDFLQARVHLALSKESNRIFKRSLICELISDDLLYLN